MRTIAHLLFLAGMAGCATKPETRLKISAEPAPLTTCCFFTYRQETNQTITVLSSTNLIQWNSICTVPSNQPTNVIIITQ